MEATAGSSLLARILMALVRLLEGPLEAVERATRRWLTGSLLGRVLERLAAAVAGSTLLDWLLGLGGPDRGMERSLIGRALTSFFDRLSGPLGKVADRAEATVVARWWRNSLLSRLVSYEAGIAFVLFFVPVSLGLTRFLPYFIKYAAEAVLLLMLGALFVELVTGRKKLRWTDLDGPVLVWITISVLSVLLNKNALVQSVFGLRAMFQYYLLALIVSNAGISRERLKGLLWALLGLVTVLGAIGVFQWLVQWPTPREWVDITETNIGTRAFGTMLNPNTYGGYLAIFLAPMIALFTAERLNKTHRVLLLGALPVILGAVLFTFSRSAWMALAVALGIVGIAKDRRIIALVLMAVLVLPVAAPTITARIAQGFSMAYFSKSAAGGRIDWWSKATEVAHEINPLFGVGPGQFGGAAANHFGTKAYKLVGLPERYPLWVDSQLFQYIAEVGYLGLFAFFWVLLAFFRCARELYRRSDELTGALTVGFAGSVLGILLFSLFASVFEMQQIASVLWFGMGLVATMKRSYDKGAMPVAGGGNRGYPARSQESP